MRARLPGQGSSGFRIRFSFYGLEDIHGTKEANAGGNEGRRCTKEDARRVIRQQIYPTQKEKSRKGEKE